MELPSLVDRSDAGIRQVYRHLVHISRRWDAQVAVLFEQTPSGWDGSFSLGLSEQCPEALRVTSDRDFARHVLSVGRVALLRRPLRAYRSFAGECHAEMLPKLSTWVFLPIESRERALYLGLGFARAFEDLREVARRLGSIDR